MQHPLDSEDILELLDSSSPHIKEDMADYVLCILLESDEFDLLSYEHRGAPELKPIPGIHVLPLGPEHVAVQYMLGTMDTPEQSYDDNEKVIEDILRQLGYNTPERLEQLGLRELLLWTGDQLTVDRIQGLWRFRHQDHNSFHHLDWIVLSYGWLHLQMAFGKFIHKRYLGNKSGFGLKHAFCLLEHRGLDTVATQGPFHENLECALYTIATARIRACWCTITGEQKLQALRK